MKRYILATLAASMIVTPAAAAPFKGDSNSYQATESYDNQYRGDNRRSDDRKISNTRWSSKYQKARYDNAKQHHRWNKGERFDRRQVTQYRVINNPRAYGLRNAPRGYRWVQSNNDAVLIGISSGIIASILTNSFR